MDRKEQLVEFWKDNFDFTEKEINAFKNVEREIFVVDDFREQAYEDVPLPLIRGKTISQPTTVMIMTSALELEEGDKVFEVGTGSGYQSAIIAKVVGDKGKVVSTEIIPELVRFSKSNLEKSNINNVEIHESDGSKYKSDDKFDKIIITAACKDFPQPLLDNLKLGGVIVGPVGSKNEQTMIKGVKLENGRLDLEFLGGFLFTPMYGEYGFEV